jgi:hypothetical protein
MDNKKITQLIVKIDRLTVAGELDWEITSPPSSIHDYRDVYISRYFQTNYKEKIIALYEERCKDYSIEFDELYFREKICFAILTERNQIIWNYSDNSVALNNLFETVTEKASNIDELFDELIE